MPEILTTSRHFSISAFTIGWRLRGHIAGERLPRAAAILDHNLLADAVSQPLRDHPAEYIVAATWRRADQQAYWL